MKYYIKILLQHFSMGLVVPIAIIWKLQNGLSLPEAVFTESIVLITTALADLPAGLLASRINNRRSLLLGGLLHIIGMLLLANGSSFGVFVAAAIVSGIAWACISGADEAYIHDDFIEDKKDYKKVFATANIMDEIATVAGMLTASVVLYAHIGMSVLFIAAAAILTLHFLYALLFLPKSQLLPATHSVGFVKALPAWKHMKGQLVAVASLMVAFAVIYEAVRPLWQPHMQQIGINIASFGAIFALLKLASITGSSGAPPRIPFTGYYIYFYRDAAGIAGI